jgi:hypothetical protein
VTRYPVQYPTACSSQAWSTGAPLLPLRTMHSLEPIGERLVVDPALPVGIGHAGSTPSGGAASSSQRGEGCEHSLERRPRTPRIAAELDRELD